MYSDLRGRKKKKKRKIENAIVIALHEGIGFELDMDTSEVAVAAMVNKNGGRGKEGSELKHTSIEKEAQVIRECVKRTLFTGKHFILK